MFIAKELGLTLEKVLDLTSLELRMWAAYYSLQRKDEKKVMEDGKRKHHSRTRR